MNTIILDLRNQLQLSPAGTNGETCLNEPLARATGLLRGLDNGAKNRIWEGLHALATRYSGWLWSRNLIKDEVVNEAYVRLPRLVLNCRCSTPDEVGIYMRGAFLITAREMRRMNLGRRACESLPSAEELAELGVYQIDPGSVNNEWRAYILCVCARALGPRTERRDTAIRLFTLHYLDGHSIDDIAVWEDMSPAAVRRSKNRTLERVRKMLREFPDDE